MAKIAEKKKGISVTQALVGIGLLFAIGVTSFFALKSSKARRDERKETKEEEFPKIDTLASNINVEEAKRRAGILFTAMDGGGTNERAVKSALSGVNNAGLKLIFNEFGVRRGENLFEWFVGDFHDEDELAEIRNIWLTQGIQVPF